MKPQFLSYTRRADSTMILQTGQEINELESSGFHTEGPTVFCGNISANSDGSGKSGTSSNNYIVQVKVARWQNLIPSFPWIAPGWRAWGSNPRKGRDQILQRSVAEP